MSKMPTASTPSAVKFLKPTNSDYLKALEEERDEFKRYMAYAERRLPHLEKEIESLKRARRNARRTNG